MRGERILIIDGTGAGPALQAGLREGGLDAVLEATLDAALARVPGFSPDAVIADVGDPGGGIGALVARLGALGSDAAVVVTVSPDRMGEAVEALRAGADGFATRPLAPAQVRLVLERALERRALRCDRAALRRTVSDRLAIVGVDPALVAAREVVARVAPTRATVLLAGEAGVGKHHLAQVLHDRSPRAEAPFVRVGCAGVCEALLEAELFGHEGGAFADDDHRRVGAFERADGGTVYLHEVGGLPPALQVKVLRVLQHGELERIGGRETIRVDVRVIASTRGDLARGVSAGRFRDDLYYRLNVVSMPLPPLRERKGDLPALASHFLARLSAARPRPVDVLSPGALSALFAYDWPGNVAELERVIERAVERCRGRELLADDLSPVLHARAEEDASTALIPGASLFEIEREAILRTLDRVGGSTARAAEILGVSVRKVQYRLKQYRDGGVAPAADAELAAAKLS